MKKIILMMLILFLNGCHIQHGRFSILTNEYMDLSDVRISQLPTVVNDSAESFNWTVLGYNVLTGPTLDEAMDDMWLHTNGDLLKPAQIRQNFVILWPFTYMMSWEVIGNVYRAE